MLTIDQMTSKISGLQKPLQEQVFQPVSLRHQLGPLGQRGEIRQRVVDRFARNLFNKNIKFILA
jgi:hypothetical protein